MTRTCWDPTRDEIFRTQYCLHLRKKSEGKEARDPQGSSVRIMLIVTPFLQGSSCAAWFSVEIMKLEYILAQVAFKKKKKKEVFIN